MATAAVYCQQTPVSAHIVHDEVRLVEAIHPQAPAVTVEMYPFDIWANRQEHMMPQIYMPIGRSTCIAQVHPQRSVTTGHCQPE